MGLFQKRLTRSLSSLVLIGFLLTEIFWIGAFVQPVSAMSVPTFKWRVSLGNAGRTFLAPLAADVNRDGKYEIVVVGGSADYANDGNVTVLSDAGDHANVLWTVQPYSKGWGGIGAHTPFEIADLDGDGIPEIIIAARQGALVLHGNDGSLYWRNAGAPAEENYLAVGDVDGDGHPEIFVNEGYGPNNGVDYLTELSYDGRVLRQAWNWHPCWGGLTLGDTNHDGIFELYQGDRNVAYGDSGDQYMGGGMGLRALDAKTLTPSWNDPTILCSSHAPILANVDKDGAGTQEVIAADQGLSGIAVLNSADGSVNANNNVNRKGKTSMSGHSEPTVYDVDGDGNLEFIDCKNSAVKIWDLYDWKLDAILPLTCLEPPKLGNVTGANDGLLDIIAVTGANSTVAIYHYNKNTGTYQNPYNLTTPYYNGLLNTNAFSLVQDVDGDGLNELILSSDTPNNGYVLCFDTLAVAPTPRARSELQFYSESRCGAAVYVPPLTPTAPVISEEQPLSGSLSQPLSPTLSVRTVDFQGPMSITFYRYSSGSWQFLDSYTNVLNGTYIQRNPTGMNSYGTTYYWNVTATSATNKTSNIYSFTTVSGPPSGSSVLVSSGGTNGTDENLICSNQSTTDPNGDSVTNIYGWNVNGNPLNTLILPFDTRTSSNPLVNEALFSDGFESGLGKWDGNGGSGWTSATSQRHSGSSSAYAYYASSLGLVSDDLDTSNAESITVSFWFRKHGITGANYVLLRFWNGTNYGDYVRQWRFVTNALDDTWLYFSIQTYDRQFLIKNFRIRFDSSGIPSGGQLWIDDVSITAPTRTKDYSGYNNSATVHGATWTSQGVVGGAYQFDGKTDYLKVPDNPSLGGNGTKSEISVEFWIKPSVNQIGARIVTKQDASQSDASYMVGFETSGSTSNTLFWGITSSFDSGWHEISNSKTVLQTGSWQHVVCTYKSGQGLAIYINSTLCATAAAIGNIAAGPGVSLFGQPLFIGYDGGGDKDPRRYLNGILDEVRIYDRALSQMQVSQRYNETRQGLSSNSTISWQETNTGDVWQCNVTPNDSFGDGTPALSNTLTIVNGTTYIVHLDSVEDNSATSHLGTITFDGTPYNLSKDVSKTAGGYSATFTPVAGYVFDNWTTTGGVSVSPNAQTTTVTVSSGGTLTAVYRTTYNVRLDSVQNNSGTSSLGTVTFDGSPYSSLPSDVSKAAGSYSASYSAAGGYMFDHWSVTSGVSVSSTTANPTTVTVSSGGTLTAVYNATGALFADGFETGSFDKWNGTTVTNGETASVSTFPVSHTGIFGARFTSNGGVSRAFCYKDIAGVSELYVSMYVYVQDGLPFGTGNAFWFIQFMASGSVLASYGIQQTTSGTRWTAMRNNVYARAASGPVEGVWYLVEAYFNRSATGKTVIFYVDGVEVASLSLNTSSANNISRVRCGIGYIDAATVSNVYIDDVKFSQTP